MFLVGLILTGTLALLPTMLQNLMNYPVLTTGLVTAPRGIGTMVGDVPRRPADQPGRQPADHPVRLAADRGLDVADDRLLAADGDGAGHHLRAAAGLRPRLHLRAAEHHRLVDPAAPHPDPGDGDPQPDAQPRRQHRHQRSSGATLAENTQIVHSRLVESLRPDNPLAQAPLSGGALQPERRRAGSPRSTPR